MATAIEKPQTFQYTWDDIKNKPGVYKITYVWSTDGEKYLSEDRYIVVMHCKENDKYSYLEFNPETNDVTALSRKWYGQNKLIFTHVEGKLTLDLTSSSV